MPGLMDYFKNIFNQLNNNLDLLDKIYTLDVTFCDPVHALDGLPALRDYYARLYNGVVCCRFEFEAEVLEGQQGMLVQRMQFQHARFGVSETLELRGVSQLRFLKDSRVNYHCDYFDMGEFIYERVPVLGSAIRAIKHRL